MKIAPQLQETIANHSLSIHIGRGPILEADCPLTGHSISHIQAVMEHSRLTECSCLSFV